MSPPRGLPPENPTPPPSTKPAQVVRRIQRRVQGELDMLGALSPGDAETALVEELGGMVARLDLGVPRLPTLTYDIMKIAPDSPLGVKQVAGIVSRDQDITSRLMKLASSPLYGSRPAGSLPEAIVRLGLTMARQVAMALSTGDTLYRIPGFEAAVRRERYTSFVVGVACSDLARRHRPALATGPAFLAGLFHDVGRTITLRAVSRVQRACGPIDPKWLTRLHEALHELLGVLFAVERALPPETCAVIGTHHDPRRSPQKTRPLAQLLWAVQHKAHETPAPLLGWPETGPSEQDTVATVSRANSLAQAVLPAP